MDIQALEGFLDTHMEDWHVPGVSIAVVRRDEPPVVVTRGVRDVAQGTPMTATTGMWVASCTKAFTALAVGLLVDARKLSWDTLISDVLPGFGMQDAYAQARMTVRDILSHRTGLPRHDRVWYKGNFPRCEIVSRMRHLPPTMDFRSGYQYNNHSYIMAGQVIEAVSGQSYEAFITERLLLPLGMQHSGFEPAALDMATPHQFRDGALHSLQPYATGPNLLSSAGALLSTVPDMARWLQLQLGMGELAGTRIASTSVMQETRTPVIPVNDPTLLIHGIETFGHPAYALGWRVNAYRGRTLIGHNGLIDGFGSHCSFMPEAGVGVCVLTNLDSADFATLASLHAYDLLLGETPINWHVPFSVKLASQQAKADAERKAIRTTRITGTRPSRVLKLFEGAYTHAGYGPVSVTMRSPYTLQIAHNNVLYSASHLHFDNFEMTRADSENVYVAVFQSDAKGRVCSCSIDFEPSCPPIVFERA